MQPNDQRGLYQPNQAQPVQPVAPPQPVQPVVQPIQPVQPAQVVAAPQPVRTVQPLQPIQQAQPVVDQATLTTALAEPAVASVVEPLQVEPNEEDADGEYDEDQVAWVASEYIHQEKGMMWFVLFGVIIAALLAVSIFVMNSWSFAALLAVIAVVVIIYSRRPPRELNYVLTEEGLMVDDKLHNFSGFKAFGVIRDGEEYSVMLIPTQRFQPGVTVYFPEEAGEDIVDMLGSRLPMKELKLDMVDRVVRLLRL